jgi:hypothetical protein
MGRKQGAREGALTIQTEKEAKDWAKAARFGECLGVDEFMRWWQNPWLRAQIHGKAAKWSRSREDYQDLWGEAWAAICSAPPNASLDTVWRLDEIGRPCGGSAYRAMQAFYKRELRHHRKEINIGLYPT